MNISKVDLKKTIEEYFETQWALQTIVTPIAWENVAFTEPTNQPWVRLNFSFFPSENVAFGIDEVRLRGELIVQIFIPPNVGTGPALKLADQVSDIFQDKIIGTIVLYESTPNNIGTGPDNNWYQVNIDTPFETM